MLVAYKDMDKAEYEDLKKINNQFVLEKNREILENGFTVAGLFGLKDPLRPNIREQI